MSDYTEATDVLARWVIAGVAIQPRLNSLALTEYSRGRVRARINELIAELRPTQEQVEFAIYTLRAADGNS